MTTRPAAYASAPQWFHWTSALLILAMIPLGFAMQAAPADLKLFLYRAHVLAGALLLLLTLARIVVRVRHPSPPALPVAWWRRLGVKGTHVALYAGIFALTASGFGMMAVGGLADYITGTSASPPDLLQTPPRLGHAALSRLYLLLLALHAGGIVRYHLLNGSVLPRMGIKLSAGVRPAAGELPPSAEASQNAAAHRG